MTDPCDALAEQSSFIGYLMGLAALGRVVQAMAVEGRPGPQPPGEPDDLVDVLVGIAGLGEAIRQMAEHAAVQDNPTVPPPADTRWLR